MLRKCLLDWTHAHITQSRSKWLPSSIMCQDNCKIPVANTGESSLGKDRLSPIQYIWAGADPDPSPHLWPYIRWVLVVPATVQERWDGRYPPENCIRPPHPAHSYLSAWNFTIKGPFLDKDRIFSDIYILIQTGLAGPLQEVNKRVQGS